MKIGIIGDGAIGRYVKGCMGERGMKPRAVLVRPGRLENRVRGGEELWVSSVGELPEEMDLVVECAGHGALAEHGPEILERGIDLITVSVGALADAALHATLEGAARNGGARLHLASGAIGALDCLQAARTGGLREVSYTGRKPPSGWKGSPAETRIDLDALGEVTVHFEGNARQAAMIYPKNANVVAAVALAGLGFESTRARLIADPFASANIHEVRAVGTFGAFTLRVEGRSLPDNPRSSALAAMSVVAAIERQYARVVV